MKTTKITLVSRYYNHELRLRVPESAIVYINEFDSPLSAINDDLDRYLSHYDMCFLSPSQARKILYFFGDDDSDFFDTVLFDSPQI